jgi:DNA polymerase III subunit beta
MRATVDRTDLLRALSRVRAALSASDVPILGTALLSVTGGRLALACTDLSLQVTDSAEVADGEDGAAAVPVEMLYDVVRRLPDMAQVLLEDQDGRINLKAGRSRFKLPALSAADFPLFPAQPGGEATFVVPGADLVRMIEGALFAAADKDPRSYLCGLHLAAEGSFLRATGTDGRWLAQVDAPLPGGAATAPPVTLPRAACAAILGAARAGADVRVTLSRTRAVFETGTAVITTKLVGGEYPDVSRVIPLANDLRFEANRAALLGVVGRVQAVARDHCVRLTLGGGVASFSVLEEKTGAEAHEDVPVDYDGDEVVVGLNSRLLMGVVEHVAGELVRVSIADDQTPVLVEGVEDGGGLYVVMPMRLM